MKKHEYIPVRNPDDHTLPLHLCRHCGAIAAVATYQITQLGTEAARCLYGSELSWQERLKGLLSGRINCLDARYACVGGRVVRVCGKPEGERSCASD
jgi:hypothetical protein